MSNRYTLSPCLGHGGGVPDVSSSSKSTPSNGLRGCHASRSATNGLQYLCEVVVFRDFGVDIAAVGLLLQPGLEGLPLAVARLVCDLWPQRQREPAFRPRLLRPGRATAGLGRQRPPWPCAATDRAGRRWFSWAAVFTVHAPASRRFLVLTEARQQASEGLRLVLLEALLVDVDEAVARPAVRCAGGAWRPRTTGCRRAIFCGRSSSSRPLVSTIQTLPSVVAHDEVGRVVGQVAIGLARSRA